MTSLRKQYELKVAELEDLTAVLASSGWKQYRAFLATQADLRRQNIIDSPKNISSDERTFLAGEISALELARCWMDALAEGLKDEIETLRERMEHDHEQADPDGTEAGTDSDSDDALVRASHTAHPGAS